DLSHGLCDTNTENLFVVQSGSVSPNPTALLQSKNFNDMIETLRKYFDYIIVDTAPIGIVIDAAIITQKCDASILVNFMDEKGLKIFLAVLQSIIVILLVYFLSFVREAELERSSMVI
ncbi:polysaccharide biosynthesis tyrosine autokinase, partial [Streptococcus pneumoniae]|uniref:polysaccharide biosynthesis tyrosine autokinase n=1 Tax=Streptococcus pneumoniae TaxID=1313 RepID=UPI000ABD0115